MAGPGSGQSPITNSRPVADPAVARLARITVQNRNTDTMSGGWNPALRTIMVMNDGSRWFTAENGTGANTAMVYYRLGPAGWRAAGSVALCTWADGDTFGVVASPTMNLTQLAAQMRAIRPGVEQSAK